MKMLISKTELDSKGSRELIPLECLHCGNTHFRPKNLVLRILNGNLKGTNKGCYCSKKCGNEHKKKSQKYKCKQCGKSTERTPSQIDGNNIFCSSSCSAKFFNKDRIIWKECLNCGKPFHPQRGTKGKYCSSYCSNQKRKKDTYKKIENGTYRAISGRVLREYLIEKYGSKCMECGWDKINPKSNKSTIQLEHTDGNSENNRLSNLKLLCPNCHSLTPTFGGLNKGNGRFYRRLRYSQGKSS